MTTRNTFTLILLVLVTLVTARPAWALSDKDVDTARAGIDRAIQYLRSTQNEDGSWTPKVGPAITAMVVAGMLDHPEIDRHDPVVKKALQYIFSKRRENGGFYDHILPNYNTSICLLALGRLAGDEKIDKMIHDAQQFVIGIQFQPGKKDQKGSPVDKDHPHYGGAGYAKYGRPDMSNTTIMLDGLFDSGLDCNDPAFKRAVEFISRCQGTAENEKYGDKIVNDGGFIYSLSGKEGEDIGEPTSPAGAEEVGGVSRLRTYGSMTYAGFKSYVYAQLDRDDPRVKAARRWIINNYNLDQNPGMPDPLKLSGYYYYLYVFSRAHQAWGEPTLTLPDGAQRDWAADLIVKLTELQNGDGSFVNKADRWMEGDRNLVTAYALLALQNTVKGK